MQVDDCNCCLELVVIDVGSVANCKLQTGVQSRDATDFAVRMYPTRTPTLFVVRQTAASGISGCEPRLRDFWQRIMPFEYPKDQKVREGHLDSRPRAGDHPARISVPLIVQISAIKVSS